MGMKDGIPFLLLLVDDDEDDREMIDEAFLAIGFAAEVKKFITGKALFHYLDGLTPSLYPSLIVLDNTLPEMDASDVLAQLKSTAAYRHIPVVVYTTDVSPAKMKQLLSLGAEACLEKGNSMKQITETARKLTSLAQNARLQSKG